jgi:hypothetical protein
MTNWYTADPHFGHENVIKFCNRPFRSANHMDAVLMQNLWAMVGPKDEAVVRTVRYLLSGPGDAIERAYDCIFGSYKLNGFGEACVMELLGWGDAKRPPFNNRSIRGIRLLGFDVEHLVAGE